ncbi:hypothetical protein [Capillimicrobium parvum]|uniref:Uncharacterized protein n=1 Tax=Capillimicrobium parvum TaxID=2884022 RepID=A0A9E6XZ12_9ACTN|nr:hypothetical protein [Capillimicrobium parvum]UGS37070.1 hypothetical protein DSM104329_03482 [Capillimicrobium parvum]
MRAEHDREADALSIDLVQAEHWDGADEPIDDSYCQVALADRRSANIELLNPEGHLELLDRVAERDGLDRQALRGAARAALEAPDRVVELDVSPATQPCALIGRSPPNVPAERLALPSQRPRRRLGHCRAIRHRARR